MTEKKVGLICIQSTDNSLMSAQISANTFSKQEIHVFFVSF
jgi:hypothetical protein